MRITSTAHRKEQLALPQSRCWYGTQLTEDLEARFMAAVKRMKQAFNLCSSSEAISDKEKDYLHFCCAVRSILFKLTKGDAWHLTNECPRPWTSWRCNSIWWYEELFETESISLLIFSATSIWIRLMQSSYRNTKSRYCSGFSLRRLMSIKRSTVSWAWSFWPSQAGCWWVTHRRDEAATKFGRCGGATCEALEELKKEKTPSRVWGLTTRKVSLWHSQVGCQEVRVRVPGRQDDWIVKVD